ncbi:hypothetical protein GCM10020000_83090 [Streptomyces olivoverticillatus]
MTCTPTRSPRLCNRPARRSRRDRAEVERLRTECRDSLLALLTRAERGALSHPEAALLRAHVEAELAACVA